MTTTYAEPVESTPTSSESARESRPTRITQPGCYVHHATGELIRVTPEDVVSGTIEGLTKGEGPILLAKISGNPYLRLSLARVQAANQNISVAF